MIDVGVRADDSFYGELVAAEQVHDAVDFVAGIENQSVAGDGVGDDRAIALQQSNRQREMKKVLRRLRQRGVRHKRQYNIRRQIACGGSRILRGSLCRIAAAPRAFATLEMENDERCSDKSGD